MNRYNFSDDSKPANSSLTNSVAYGQIWSNKISGLKIAIDSPGNLKGAWNIHTKTLGNRVNTQIKEQTLLMDYERM